MIIMSTLVIGCIRQEERGLLEVSVSIGPLCPVEPCDITPKQLEKMYEGIKIFIYSENKILVKEIKLDNTGNYKVELNPGRYIVDTDNIGIGGSKDLPKEVNIESGKTIKLNINIDTGIRTPTSIPISKPITTSTPRNSNSIPIEHIIFIAFENKKYDSVVSIGPYFKYLADTYGRATQAYDIHNICGDARSYSLPSYLTVTSGNPFNKCDTDEFIVGEFDTKNIFSLVNDAGMTWAQYAEGISGPCRTKGTKFAARHVPALFYRNIVQNTDYCKNHVVPLTDWYNNISSGQIPPNFAFISPDLCNDAHDCSVSIADNWLKNTFNLPNLLTKSWAQSTVFFSGSMKDMANLVILL